MKTINKNWNHSKFTKDIDDSLSKFDDGELFVEETFSENSTGLNLPSKKLKKTILQNNINILDLIIFSKLEKSKSEIRRLIRGNAVKLNNEVISDEKLIIDINFFNENYLKLSIGKKRHLKIELI